jgi:hypothetical protein
MRVPEVAARRSYAGAPPNDQPVWPGLLRSSAVGFPNPAGFFQTRVSVTGGITVYRAASTTPGFVAHHANRLV